MVWHKIIIDLSHDFCNPSSIEKINVELNISSVSIVKVDSFTDNPKCFQFTILVGHIIYTGTKLKFCTAENYRKCGG